MALREKKAAAVKASTAPALNGKVDDPETLRQYREYGRSAAAEAPPNRQPTHQRAAGRRAPNDDPKRRLDFGRLNFGRQPTAVMRSGSGSSTPHIFSRL